MLSTRILLALAAVTLVILLTRQVWFSEARAERAQLLEAMAFLKKSANQEASETKRQATDLPGSESPAGPDPAETRDGVPSPAGFDKAPEVPPEAPDRSRASSATAAYLGKTLTLAQLRACAAQSGLKPEADRNFRAVAAAANMGADGEQRIAWALEACSTPGERAETLSKIMSSWAPQDINDAGKWLDGQASGPEKDAAIAAFAREVIQREPPTAVDWALTISDPGLRATALREVSTLWRGKDPQAAEAYLSGKEIR
ncbi:MAG: hypothetical protein V4726_20405 [Verrucomicrobiota bacterium]